MIAVPDGIEGKMTCSSPDNPPADILMQLNTTFPEPFCPGKSATYHCTSPGVNRRQVDIFFNLAKHSTA